MESGLKVSGKRIACYKNYIRNAKISKFSCFQSQEKKGDEAGQRVLWKT